MVKPLKIFFFWIERNLKVGMQPWVLKYYQFVQVITLGWPWPILRQGKIWPLMVLYGKKIKQWIFRISKVNVIHWPLSKVTQIQHVKTSFPLKTIDRLKLYFMLCLHGLLGWKFVQMFRVTRPRWLPGPYMVKTLKNLLLRNQEADYLETCYTASSNQVLPNLFKWWHWVDLAHFYNMVKLFS